MGKLRSPIYLISSYPHPPALGGKQEETLSAGPIELWRQKQVSGPWINNYNTHNTVGCNCFFMPYIPVLAQMPQLTMWTVSLSQESSEFAPESDKLSSSSGIPQGAVCRFTLAHSNSSPLAKTAKTRLPAIKTTEVVMKTFFQASRPGCNEVNIMVNIVIMTASYTTWAASQYKDVCSMYGYFIIKIRRSWDRLIFIMEIPLLVRRHLYIDMDPVGAMTTPDVQCRYISDDKLSTDFHY